MSALYGREIMSTRGKPLIEPRQCEWLRLQLNTLEAVVEVNLNHFTFSSETPCPTFA